MSIPAEICHGFVTHRDIWPWYNLNDRREGGRTMEGLCGRACDTCTWRDPLDCPGCQTGPGRPYSGDCGIADCCRKKGHADCSSCTYISCCHLRCQREDMPRRRLRELEERQQRQDWLDRNAPVLAKWLWLLFWLVIPRTLAETLTLDVVASASPAAGTVGEVLGPWTMRFPASGGGFGGGRQARCWLCSDACFWCCFPQSWRC